MSEPVIRQTTVVQNAQGIHARPADLIARTAGQFDAQVWIERSGERIDAKSILSVLTLAAGQGTELIVCASGPDAEQAVQAMVELIESGFRSAPVEDTANGHTNDP